MESREDPRGRCDPLRFSFRFELLEILSFDSVRRRMSVIVKSATGKISFSFIKLYMVVVFYSDD